MFSYNSQYLTKNGKPWYPVMGEMHYSRCPREKWPDSLYKMKAGGVTIASSYVIWIHHEEIEGEVDFSGNKDVGAFFRACGEAGLYAFPRIGPWSHAEVRNGGFPDWLLRYNVRVNDSEYLEQVERYYSLIFEQLQGLLHKDGGPIIGIQIENELGHCGGASGEQGELHMQKLLAIAKKVGFDVPYYTATGWGGAATGGLIPVMGGYADAPWDRRLTEIEPSGNFIFTHERNDHNIGSDFKIGDNITFDMTKYPYLTAELGGGLQVTKHRRPVSIGKDAGAMSLAKMGSGANLLGYYMYHGGTNPKGKLTTLQESRISGGYCDLPILSYDFRTAISEYGQITDAHKEIKLLAYFLHDFGTELANMPAYIPKENPLSPDNNTDLRWSVRHNGEWGFLFINNYQRRRQMAEHKGVRLEVRIGDKSMETTPFNVKNGDYFFYPINMPVNGGIIKWATATPFCMDGSTMVFYGDKDAVFLTEGNPDYRLISGYEALNSYKCADRLVFSEFPIIENSVGGWDELVTEDVDKCCEFVEIAEGRYIITLKYPEHGDDWFLCIDYRGESAKAYVDGEFVADNFYIGPPWTWSIGMKRLGLPKEIAVEIETLRKDDAIYLDSWPEMADGQINCIDNIKLTKEIRKRR